MSGERLLVLHLAKHDEIYCIGMEKKWMIAFEEGGRPF